MQGDRTEEEYLALDTNRLVELSDGKLDVLPHLTSKAGDELTSAQVPGWTLAVAELFKAANEK